MPDEPTAESLNPFELRRQIMERLQGRHGKVVEMPADRVEALVHELEVYQVELEVQNEELRRAQLEAAAALERYRDLYEGAPVGYLTVDAVDRIIQANRAASQLCSRDREELEGRVLKNLLVPEDGEKLWLLLRSAAATGKLQSGEFRLAHSGLHPRWVHADVSLLNPRVGAAGGFRMTLTDITRRVSAEEALRQSEASLTQAIRVANLGTFDHDQVLDAIKFSPLMREMLSFGDGEEITLAKVMERVHPDDRQMFTAAVKKALDPTGTGSFEVEHRVANRHGQVRWLSVRAQTFFEGRGSARRPVRTVGAALDVSEHKEFQAGLERLVAERTARLQELVNELEHFSYTITHDMRAPLRAMMGFGELMNDWCGACEHPQRREFVKKIMTAAERMDHLITDALNYGRSVRQELPLEDVDTEALVRGMLDTYPELQPARANVRFEGRLPLVVGNQAGLTQCFSNLLGNAAKFVEPGQMPEIRVWAEERGEWARIWVEDRGIGIEKTLLPRVFDMFSRGNHEYEGTGIGLALVRKAVQRMGGHVGVESEVGNGSRFWLELRRAQKLVPPRTERESETNWNANPEAKAWTVLYVEDEEGDAFFMRNAFARAGLGSALRVMTDGRSAIEYLSGTGPYADRKEYPVPTLVLLDLNLPIVPGFEVLKWTRQQPAYAATPVVIFSSSTKEEDRAQALELGANDFLVKPSSGLSFGEVVKELNEKWLKGAEG